MADNSARQQIDSVRKKFGLDFLPSSGSSLVPNLLAATTPILGDSIKATFDSCLRQALGTFGGTVVNVLVTLMNAPEAQDRVYDILDRSGVDFDSVIRILENLNSSGLIQYLQKDARGNHLIQLTSMGRSVTALLGQAMSLLVALKNSPDHSKRIYDLVESSNIDFDSVIKLVEQLSTLGFVQYVQKDSRGNHLIQITESGLTLMR